MTNPSIRETILLLTESRRSILIRLFGHRTKHITHRSRPACGANQTYCARLMADESRLSQSVPAGTPDTAIGSWVHGRWILHYGDPLVTYFRQSLFGRATH